MGNFAKIIEVDGQQLLIKKTTQSGQKMLILEIESETFWTAALAFAFEKENERDEVFDTIPPEKAKELFDLIKEEEEKRKNLLNNKETWTK